MGIIELRDLPISLIKIPESYVKSKYDKEKLELLKRSIQAQGQIEPIIVCHTDGEYYLIDGLHRLLALRELGYKMVKAIVHDCHDLSDVLLKNLVANYMKRPHDPLSFIKVAKVLLERYGPVNLARWTGYSDMYWRYIKDVVTYLPNDLIEKAVKEYGASVTKLILAAQLVKFYGKSCLRELYSDKFWKMSTREMRKYIVNRTRPENVKIQEEVAEAKSGTMPRQATESKGSGDEVSVKRVEKFSERDLVRLVANYLVKQLDELDCSTLSSICGVETEKCDDAILSRAKQEVKIVLETYLESLDSKFGP